MKPRNLLNDELHTHPKMLEQYIKPRECQVKEIIKISHHATESQVKEIIKIKHTQKRATNTIISKATEKASDEIQDIFMIKL